MLKPVARMVFTSNDGAVTTITASLEVALAYTADEIEIVVQACGTDGSKVIYTFERRNLVRWVVEYASDKELLQ